jgi:tetratricopeptide (TPR) repeat protein
VHIELGEFKRAIDFSEKAISISQEIGDRTIEARALGNLGIAHRNFGELEKAGEYYSRQLNITREVGDRLGEGSAQYNLALSLEAAGDPASAVAEMRRAAAILEEVRSPLAERAKAWLAGSGGFETVNINAEARGGGFEDLRQLRDATRKSADQQLKQVLK